MLATDLHTLAYFSRNCVAETEGALQTEIAGILRSARVNNRQFGVTGALLFSAGCFAQVLEGPLPGVEAIFERIQCDPRHRDVTVLHFKPIEQRSFAHWSMAFAGLPSPGEAPVAFDGWSGGPEVAAANAAGEDLVVVLRDLIGRYDAA
jgi:hypothetical protein